MAMSEEHIRQLRIHFDGTATLDHTLPASVLVQALDRFQRVVHLIAMAEEGREVQQRARVTREIERRFPLVCSLPEQGGYALPITIGGPSAQLFDEQECEKIARNTRQAIEAVNTGDARILGRIIPDMFYRRNVLNALEAMQPGRHSGLIINIEDFNEQKIFDGSTAPDKIRQLLAPQTSEVSPSDLGYVTGSLIEMKFNERRLSLKLPGSNRSPLTATYSEDFEPVLLSHPRELIQVHGNIVWNDDGTPQSISDVDEVLEIDESSIDIFMVELDGTVLKPKHALYSDVSFDRETSLYQADGPFDILLNALTRPCLETQLYEELTMLWLEYAKTDPITLTQDAQQLREELLDSFEEISNAN
ncbi:MAG: hypothetical protein WCI23_04255 [Chlorobiaceae bacterium]